MALKHYALVVRLKYSRTSARTTRLRRATTGAEGARKLLMEDGRAMRLCTATGLESNAEVCMLIAEKDLRKFSGLSKNVCKLRAG